MSQPEDHPPSAPRHVIFDIPLATLRYAGVLHAGPTWSHVVEPQTIWEFIYYQRGCGRIVFPHITLHPQQYYLAVLPPGLSRVEFSDPIDPEQTLWFGVNVTGAASLDTCLMLPDPRGDFRWLCEHIVEEYQTYGNSTLGDTYTRAFLELLERAWKNGAPLQRDAIDVAAQYIQSNYAQPISVSLLAATAHYCESHFTHLFTARLGISPIRYLQRVRIDAACRLLTTTDLPVSDISAQVGYTDPRFFSRTFTSVIGRSPRAFRAQR